MPGEILENFVVFEGCDGSGTTTQIEMLRARFAAGDPGKKLFTTAEPTDGIVGRLIRAALKNSPALHPATLAGLFAADRNEHLLGPGGICERCRSGELVVCDRYVLSSLVYQGLQCGEELPRRLNAEFPAPRLLLFFDIEPEAAWERMKDRRSLEIFETRDFQQKVRGRYLSLLETCRQPGTAVEIIDASATREKIAEDVWRALSQMPIFRAGADAIDR